VIVLVSDGKENCDADPVGTIKAAATPVKLTLHVVGFKQSSDSDWQVVQQAVEVQQGTIVQIAL
jgi:hypothetical protein